jgi:hypothetical protein
MVSSQQSHHDGTLRYKMGIVILLYLQAMFMIWTSSRLFGSDDCSNTAIVEREAAFPLPKAPDFSHFNSNNGSSIISQEAASLNFYNDNNNNNDPCSILMKKFHQINARFRQHGNNDSYSYANADPQPYVNYAYYSGQGFGRLVDHTSLNCILSLHLGRACVLDLSTRDPFFTWRSFIHRGTYDWEMQQGNRLLEEYYREEIDRAVAEMKDIGAGSWENGVVNITSYHKLFLLKDEPNTTIARFLQEYRIVETKYATKGSLISQLGTMVPTVGNAI